MPCIIDTRIPWEPDKRRNTMQSYSRKQSAHLRREMILIYCSRKFVGRVFFADIIKVLYSFIYYQMDIVWHSLLKKSQSCLTILSTPQWFLWAEYCFQILQKIQKTRYQSFTQAWESSRKTMQEVRKWVSCISVQYVSVRVIWVLLIIIHMLNYFKTF